MHNEHVISRRGFVAGTGAAALAGGAAVAAGGARTALAQVPANASDRDTGAGAFPTSVDQDPYFAAPDPVSAVAQAYDYDVVVVGAGASGIPAACAAADNGAKVAVLQKSPRVYSHGVLWSG